MKHVASFCVSCQRASLVLQRAEPEVKCRHCGAASQLIPTAEFLPGEVALFEGLEQVVHRANLTPTVTASITADLEAVSMRWEPPELVLARIAPKLPGLRRWYNARQNYAHLVQLIGMLLMIVGGLRRTPAAQDKTRWRDSGVRPAYRSFDDLFAPVAKRGASK